MPSATRTQASTPPSSIDKMGLSVIVRVLPAGITTGCAATLLSVEGILASSVLLRRGGHSFGRRVEECGIGWRRDAHRLKRHRRRRSG
jgi:hypothetical protein